MYAVGSSCSSRSPERARLTNIESVPPRYGNPLESPTQSKDDVDKRFHFHRFVAEQRGLVAPLLYRLRGRLDQKGRAGDDFKLLNRAFLGDDRVQPHCSLNARLPRERGIDRPGLVENFCFLHARADANALGGLRLGGRRSAADSSDDAAHDAAGHATRDAAWDAAGTGVDGHIGGKLLFLDHLHVFWNYAR